MQIQVNTDNQIRGSEPLTRRVESVVQAALERFGSRVTRVEVHLSDQNGRQKSGDDDKRCVMEARLAGLRPITVRESGATLDQAVEAAAAGMEKRWTAHWGGWRTRRPHLGRG
ncbi:MAG: ribosomal subunit interface protein, partial [Planctomycetes bacterium]|nr:ribosomal subunit interface protein [Planctomycetota bacterium]